MGNQLEREHDVGPVVATGGPDGIWKIYTAKKKDTGEPVSIWVFEKKQLEKHSRDVQEAVLAMLRADVTNLSRLVHPNVVRVLQPLMETRALLVAQTEPIFASLANVLRDFSGLPKVPSALENFELDPLEAKLGLLELAEGLAFLHGHARIVHRNVCPESIFLTQKGMWKLGGFHFGLFLSSRQAGETMRLDYREFDYKPPFRVSPNLDYMAPEAADGQWEPSSDMWSLGMVAWQLHTRKPPPSTRNNLLTHRAVVERIRTMDWTQFPDALQAPLARMLSEQPHSRPDVRTFLESPYFKDTLLLALVFLNDLITKDNPSKLKFFKGLASVLPRFPPRLIKEKVVPALLAELGRSEGELQALVLQSVLASSRGTLTTSEFSRLVLPSLLPLITPEAPMPCLLLLLGELETLAKLAPPDDVSQYLVPLVVRALESPNPKLNEEALKQLPKAVRVFDVAAVRDVVVPRLELLMANTRLEPIRARILITLKDVVEIVDKSTVSDRILAIVDTCLAIDRSAPTLMRCIVVYDLISEKVGMEITAARILPFVVPLLLEPQLGAQQIAFVMERIKSMLERVGEARLKRLAAATEPKAETTALTTEAEFEAVVASEGVKKAADRTRSHGTPPASISSYPTSSVTAPSSAFHEGSLMHSAQSSSAPFQSITMPASSYNFPSHPTSSNGMQQRLLPTAAPSASRPALAPSLLSATRPFPGQQSPAGLDSHHNLLSAPQASLLQHSPLHTAAPAAQLPTTASHPQQLPSATSPATAFSFPAPPRAGSVSASVPQPASPSPLFGLTPPPSHQPAPQASGMLPPLHMNLQPPKPHGGGQPGFSPPPSGARPPVDNSTSLL